MSRKHPHHRKRNYCRKFTLRRRNLKQSFRRRRDSRRFKRDVRRYLNREMVSSEKVFKLRLDQFVGSPSELSFEDACVIMCRILPAEWIIQVMHASRGDSFTGLLLTKEENEEQEHA